MMQVSLLGVAAYMPETEVGNEAFADGAGERRGMFTAPKTRRWVGREETAASMIEKACGTLSQRLDLDFARDVDIIFTNVAVPDQAFTGCGADVAHRIGAKPRWVVDLHNTGCVSFIYMIELARAIMSANDARGALLCTVQNAAGRVFSNPAVRSSSQSPVPGDGCGVGFVAAGDVAPIVSLVHRVHPGNASDMVAYADDGRHYWEPGLSPILLGFTPERVASIIERGNRMVPDMVMEACVAAGVDHRELDLLVTNQPNPIFLRNWREALELPAERHHDTYARYGNLFGAGIPVNLDDALAQGKLAPGALVGLGGFAHAGDYTAAAVMRWRADR